MDIYIDGKLAELTSSESFEYVVENKLFSGAEGYTLSITFPLAGNKRNMDIFGRINRKDVPAKNVRFESEIRTNKFVLRGVMTITEIDESEVKCQFLVGRSVQNFDDTFDTIYINELDLGTPEKLLPSEITPDEAWTGRNAVAIPWVNDYSGNIQNSVESVDSKTVWSGLQSKLSWQPFLIYIARQIAATQNFTCNFEQWENSEYAKLLICNALPAAWDLPGYAKALPHWTIEEFFNEIELFLGGQFTIDYSSRTISFAFINKIVAASDTVELTQVVDSHSVDVSPDEQSADFTPIKKFVYKDCDHEMWKFYCCPWFIRDWNDVVLRYDTLAEAINKYKKWAETTTGYTPSEINKLIYAADVDLYYIIRCLRTETSDNGKTYTYIRILQPLNQFGESFDDPDDEADSEELSIVPAWLDDTDSDHGSMIFLPLSTYEGSGVEDEEGGIPKSLPQRILEAGEEDKSAEYLDRIYVGFYDRQMSSGSAIAPCPYICSLEVNENWSIVKHEGSLRLNDPDGIARRTPYSIDPTKKYTFSFLSDVIPDITGIFIIAGKRYVCEKLTATFKAETGMSQLIKGVFYQMTD
jgi:hypothetical protein